MRGSQGGSAKNGIHLKKAEAAALNRQTGTGVSPHGRSQKRSRSEHVSGAWPVRKPLPAQTYFCNSRSPLRSLFATSPSALRSRSRSTIFCHARSTLRSLHPIAGPLSSVYRSTNMLWSRSILITNNKIDDGDVTSGVDDVRVIIWRVASTTGLCHREVYLRRVVVDKIYTVFNLQSQTRLVKLSLSLRVYF